MKKTTASVDEIKATRLITAIKTPYLPDGRPDLAAYDELIEKQIEGGVEGVIVGGTTGEGQLMSWDEHIMLIAHTAKLYGDKLQVVGNTGSNSTREAVHATSQGFAVGEEAERFGYFSLRVQRTEISLHLIFSKVFPLSADASPPTNDVDPARPRATRDPAPRYGRGASHQPLLRQDLQGWHHGSLQRCAGLWAHHRVQRPSPHLPGHHPRDHA